jgi:hypothetical protein
MKRSAIFGGVIWGALAAASLLGLARLTLIELLFLLAPFVLVPLGLELCAQSVGGAESSFLLGTARWVQLPAALCVAGSFRISPGIAAAILVIPWFGFGCVAGIAGLRSLFGGGYKQLQSACRIASLLYFPVGCAWLVASRLGLMPMGFQEPIVLLTAVHFHFAGFGAPLPAMACGTALQKKGPTARRMFAVIAAGVLAGPGLLAAGFVIGPRLKLAMALLVACSEAGLSLYFLAAIPNLRPRLSQILVAFSAASVLFAMAFAAVWAIGEFPLQPFVYLSEMAKFHGVANALGFVLCGLIGWTLSKSSSIEPRGNEQ